MTTRKDLADAESFARRRLVAAFLSGARGRRDGDVPRSGRAIVGGLALAALLIVAEVVARLALLPEGMPIGSLADPDLQRSVSDRPTSGSLWPRAPSAPSPWPLRDVPAQRSPGRAGSAASEWRR